MEYTISINNGVEAFGTPDADERQQSSASSGEIIHIINILNP